MKLYRMILFCPCAMLWNEAFADGIFKRWLYVKTPGNTSRVYDLESSAAEQGVLKARSDLPLTICREQFREGAKTDSA